MMSWRVQAELHYHPSSYTNRSDFPSINHPRCMHAAWRRWSASSSSAASSPSHSPSPLGACSRLVCATKWAASSKIHSRWKLWTFQKKECRMYFIAVRRFVTKCRTLVQIVFRPPKILKFMNLPNFILWKSFWANLKLSANSALMDWIIELELRKLSCSRYFKPWASL